MDTQTPEAAGTTDAAAESAPVESAAASSAQEQVLDLEDKYRGIIEELSALVDEDGDVIGGEEASLGDVARVDELQLKAHELHKEMQKHIRTVTFEAMPSDEWEAFDASHRKDGKIKDLQAFNRALIARCAIAPKLTEAQVDQLRKKLGAPQMVTLSNEAYWANTTGGLDIPKLPSFSHSQEQQES